MKANDNGKIHHRLGGSTQEIHVVQPKCDAQRRRVDQQQAQQAVEQTLVERWHGPPMDAEDITAVARIEQLGDYGLPSRGEWPPLVSNAQAAAGIFK